MLLQFARLKAIEGKDAFILEACFANIVWDQMSLPFSRPNEILALQSIIDVCQSTLGAMIPKGDPKDSVNDSSTRDGLMTRLRIQERTTVEATISKLQSILFQVKKEGDRTEYYQERRLRELNLDGPLEGSEIMLDGDVDLDEGENADWMR